MKKILIALTFMLANTQFLLAMNYNGNVLPGYIKGAHIDYIDSGIVALTTGYGECNGKFWQITTEAYIELNDTDVLSGGIPYGEDFIYIYIDYSSVDWSNPLVIDDTATTDVIGSLTEPTWSDLKQGWYNGDDRCIGAIWTPVDSSTIQYFRRASSNKYIINIKKVQDNGNPSSTWQECEETEENYTPVNTTAIFITANNRDPNQHVRVAVCTYEETAQKLDTAGYTEGALSGWLYVNRNWSRKLKWLGYDDDDNSFDVNIYGYEIER